MKKQLSLAHIQVVVFLEEHTTLLSYTVPRALHTSLSYAIRGALYTSLSYTGVTLEEGKLDIRNNGKVTSYSDSGYLNLKKSMSLSDNYVTLM